MEQEIKTLLEGLTTKNGDLLTLIGSLQNEVKQHGTGQTETKTAIDKILTEEHKMRDELKELRLKVESNAYSDGGPRIKSIGAQFVESVQFKGLEGGRLGLNSGRVSVKDVTSAAASVGAGLPQPLRTEMIRANPQMPLMVRDLLNVVPTTLTSMEFVKYTFTNNAKIIIDTTVTPNKREGVAKPKSDMTMTKANAIAETMAHWVAASKQILADMSGLQGIIDGELRYGLDQVEENELLNGDGTAGHLNGLNTQATAFDTTLVGSGPTALDITRAILLQARLALRPVSGFVMNPHDWFDIETVKDDLGRYMIGNPQGTIGRTLWGMPVAESDSQPYKKVLAGAFRTAATLYDREETNVETRDTHANFFIENMIAIRAEKRIMFVVTVPQAFVKATLP